MNKTSDILQHFKGYELLVKQIVQAQERYIKSDINIALNFMNPDEIDVASKILANNCPYSFVGGYQQAIKRKLIIGDNINQEEYITCLRAKFNDKYNKLTHRDVLGALYSQQIEMNRFGDLWVEDDYIYLYCEKEIASYLIDNFHEVANCHINFEQCQFREQIFKFNEFSIVVSSLRLDQIVGDIIHKSREQGKRFINSGMVNVNYKTIEESAFVCHNDDILSLRRFGRYQISDISMNQRSGNYKITIKKYMW